MNLALLFQDDFVATDTAVLTGRRLAHLHSVLKVAEGDLVPVGLVDGDIAVSYTHLTLPTICSV